MLDLYQRISVLGDKNIQQQWMRVGMVSQKYRAGPVFNLGGALNGIFLWLVSVAVLCYYAASSFFVRHPSPEYLFLSKQAYSMVEKHWPSPRNGVSLFR
ncbi:hypothetical protein [Aeromonas hydrophila]|uniref:hypothetical protein n=1 Tax=Aeromonas hydrophila TaxID=644 RepID=UPI0019203847|nr:hypothetical protein [Aeromonas hydrophila]MBL0571989.1 hypothetical protein [Aeromonas hydrophila]